MSLTAPNPIVKPFCNSGTQVSPPVGADTFVANQETGFPNSQATPLPAGTEVQQNEMNGVLRLYTSLLLWLNSGGQFTFNQAFSDANNGYALDNILWCASNSTFQRSLVTNNTANFVTTPSYINDGINWIDVNNASFPDIQDNPTTGNVTIGGRVANSANNIRTLGVGGTGYAGLSTANASTQLYATEADGTTINTGIVNQYGYRAYHTGTTTAILDPAKTYAYVSELPVVTNNIRVKSYISGFSLYQLQAIFNGTLWGCTISGSVPLTGSLPTFSTIIDLSTLGISGATVGELGCISLGGIDGSYTVVPYPGIMTIDVNTFTSLQLSAGFDPAVTGVTGIKCGFSITFTATSVS
jgi:hypothetical protein